MVRQSGGMEELSKEAVSEFLCDFRTVTLLLFDLFKLL